MNEYTLLEKIIRFITLDTFKYNLKMKIFKSVLKENNLDFGKYYMSELIEMYEKHKTEINFN